MDKNKLEIKPILFDELVNHEISFYSYHNGGNYREIPEIAIGHKDFKELCEYHNEGHIKKSNFNLVPAFYDERIGKYVMKLLADCEHVKYGYVQQYICFVVVGKPFLVNDVKLNKSSIVLK